MNNHYNSNLKSKNKSNISNKNDLNSSFMTASDLLNKNFLENQKGNVSNNSISYDEFLQILLKNSKDYFVIQKLDLKDFKKRQIKEVYFVLTLKDNKTIPFDGKFKFFGKEMQNDNLIDIICIQIRNQEFFSLFKENLHYFLSIEKMEEILSTLVVNK